MTSRITVLQDAWSILNQKHRETCDGPKAIWQILVHAKNYVSTCIDEELRDEPQFEALAGVAGYPAVVQDRESAA